MKEQKSSRLSETVRRQWRYMWRLCVSKAGFIRPLFAMVFSWRL